jgi:hypothetical protein
VERYSDGFKQFNDRSKAMGNRTSDQIAIAGQLEELANAFGFEVNPQQLAAMKLPNTTKAAMAYGWLQYYFGLVGDCEPNKNGEIHIEYCTLSQVHKEYLTDMQASLNPADLISVHELGKLWITCFG